MNKWKGKGADAGGGGEGSRKGGEKPQMCLAFLRGACSKSEKDCKFSHSPKEAQKLISAGYAGATAGGVQPPSSGDAGASGSVHGGLGAEGSRSMGPEVYRESIASTTIPWERRTRRCPSRPRGPASGESQRPWDARASGEGRGTGPSIVRS